MIGPSLLVVLTACGGGGEGGTDDGSTGTGVDAGERLDDAPQASPFADVDDDPAGDSPVTGIDGGEEEDGQPSTASGDVATEIPGAGQDGPVPATEAGEEPVDAGALRIVLTWERRPNDLDAHLTGPDADEGDRFHVFSGARDAGVARLSEDATGGAGPETIEIDRPEPGVYRYSVFNFSGDDDRPLGRSGARVEVFSGGASVADFAVPAGVGDLWTVFDIEDGRIVPVNTLARLRTVEDYFASRRRDPAAGSGLASDAAPLGPDGYR